MSIVTGGVLADGSGIVLMARIVGNLGQPVTQASLTSIGYTVTDLTNALALGSGTFTVASSIFDSLQQTDARWTFDTAAKPGTDGLFGYNFLGVLPASLFPVSTPAGAPATPIRVQCDVVFTPATGQPFRQIFSWIRRPVFG